MLPTVRPDPSPDLATTLSADAAKDENRRKWWIRILGAHLECISDYRNGLNQIEIEVHTDALYTLSTNGTAAVILRHAAPPDLPTGRATISAADIRRYLQSCGWAPLGATTEGMPFPDLRGAVTPARNPWKTRAISGGPMGMDAFLLDLPARVAGRLKVRKVPLKITTEGGLTDPVFCEGPMGDIHALIVLMPLRID